MLRFRWSFPITRFGYVEEIGIRISRLEHENSTEPPLDVFQTTI